MPPTPTSTPNCPASAPPDSSAPATAAASHSKRATGWASPRTNAICARSARNDRTPPLAGDQSRTARQRTGPAGHSGHRAHLPRRLRRARRARVHRLRPVLRAAARRTAHRARGDLGRGLARAWPGARRCLAVVGRAPLRSLAADLRPAGGGRMSEPLDEVIAAPATPDYAGEIRALIDTYTASGPYIARVVATRILTWLRHNNRKLLAGWLNLMAEELLYRTILDRDRSRRSAVIHRARRAAFRAAAGEHAGGDSGGLTRFLDLPFPVESGHRKRLAD